MRDYLVSKGVDKAKIETIGMGEKQPVVQCDQKNHEGADRVPAAEPPRGSAGQGRDDEVVTSQASHSRAPPRAGLFLAVRRVANGVDGVATQPRLSRAQAFERAPAVHDSERVRVAGIARSRCG